MDEIGVADVSAVRRHSSASDHSLNDWRLSSPQDSNLIRERFWLATRCSSLLPRILAHVCVRHTQRPTRITATTCIETFRRVPA